MAGKVSSTRFENSARCRTQYRRGSTEKVRHFTSWCWPRDARGAVRRQWKHCGIRKRLVCVWELTFWRLSIQDICREHIKADDGDVADTGRSASGDGHEQENGAASSADCFGFILCDKLCKRWEKLAKGEESEGRELRKKLKDNDELYHTESPSSATSFRLYKQLVLRPLWKWKYGEEVFVDHGRNYELQ